MKNLILCFSFCGFAMPSLAQIPRTGDLLGHVDSILSTTPGNSGNDYQPMDNFEQSTWHSMLETYCTGDYASSQALAGQIGYQFLEFTDVNDQNVYHVFQKSDTSNNHWGTYIFNPNPCRSQLTIQAPHPKKDFNTGKEAAWCFYHTGAAGLAISGASRCNNDSLSVCDGSTSVCAGSSEPYRISDQAHIADGAMQITTIVTSQCNTDHYFVQLHGFSKLSTDSFLILSNGSQDLPQTSDYLAILGQELQVIDDTLSYVVAHQNLSWTRLIALTNTQGRMLNNSLDACEDNASINTGHFLHVEQEKTRLRDNSAGWDKMANALAATFPCDTVITPGFGEILSRMSFLRPNPATNEVEIRLPRGTRMNQVAFEIVDIQGRAVTLHESATISDVTATFNVNHLVPGMYFVRVTMLGNQRMKHFKFIKQ